jgi:hypothetical protein
MVPANFLLKLADDADDTAQVHTEESEKLNPNGQIRGQLSREE